MPEKLTGCKEQLRIAAPVDFAFDGAAMKDRKIAVQPRAKRSFRALADFD